jgi:hypothetical protein
LRSTSWREEVRAAAAAAAADCLFGRSLQLALAERSWHLAAFSRHTSRHLLTVARLH